MKLLPFTSQFSAELPKEWQARSCGITALKIAMDYWHERNSSLPAPSLREAFDIGLAVDAYQENVGWLHKGLIQVAKRFGYSGYNVEGTHRQTDEFWQELRNVVTAFPAIVSVRSKFDPTSKDGHLVVVTSITDTEVAFLDPEERTAKPGRKTLPVKTFRAAFKHWYIVITPNMGRGLAGQSKLDLALAANMDIRSSLLSMALGSVGSKQYQHVYRRINGVSTDILENGDVSCAVHVTSILYLWGLVEDTHATVSSTVRDLLSNDWMMIDEPKVGCVITWEKKSLDYGKWFHPHIGFYVGNDQAVSNDRDTKVPAIHHYTYGTTEDGQPTRLITGLYWHPSLDR